MFYKCGSDGVTEIAFRQMSRFCIKKYTGIALKVRATGASTDVNNSNFTADVIVSSRDTHVHISKKVKS